MKGVMYTQRVIASQRPKPEKTDQAIPLFSQVKNMLPRAWTAFFLSVSLTPNMMEISDAP